MKLARTLRLDVSDDNVYELPAPSGEWAISGGFEFSNWSEGDLVGKAKQAFSNGWMGIETFGRASLVAVAQIEPYEREALAKSLAQHFVDIYGAPSVEAAMGTALEEIDHMIAICEEQPPNTLLTVARELTEAGVRESYGMIEPQSAGLEQFAVHGSLDDEPHQH